MRPATLASVLALCVCACACRESGASGSDAAAALPRAAAASVPVVNFAKIDDGLYRGAQPDSAGFRALRELGVKTIVNLREAHSDAAMAPPAGLDLVEIPLHAFADSDPPTDADLARFLDVALDPSKRPVFVHCARGKDRTGTMCAVYRMEVDGWTPDQAFTEMQSFGFHDYYKDLERYVRGYTPRFAERVRAFTEKR
jgi:protein tyrosine/serine phosphatase